MHVLWLVFMLMMLKHLFPKGRITMALLKREEKKFIEETFIKMNLCAILVNCNDYTDELSSIFTLDNDVLLADEEKLMGIYRIADEEAKNISVEDLIIDRITKLAVDY